MFAEALKRGRAGNAGFQKIRRWPLINHMIKPQKRANPIFFSEIRASCRAAKEISLVPIAFYQVKKLNDQVKKENDQVRGRFDLVKKENDQVKLSAHLVTERIHQVNFKISLVTVAVHQVNSKILQVKTRFPHGKSASGTRKKAHRWTLPEA